MYVFSDHRLMQPHYPKKTTRVLYSSPFLHGSRKSNDAHVALLMQIYTSEPQKPI